MINKNETIVDKNLLNSLIEKCNDFNKVEVILKELNIDIMENGVLKPIETIKSDIRNMMF